MIKHPTLYTVDSKGKTRTWRMEVDGDRYRSIAGLLDGEKVESGWTIAQPKNVGRANATTAEQQAELEVLAEYKKKRDRKYHDDLAEVAGAKFFAPMLAHEFKSLPPGRAYSQPKLDEVRCIATATGLFSRQGKPFTAVPHIAEALAPLFAKHPMLVLDGELYQHELRDDFNQITSIVRKVKPSAEEIAIAAEKIQYHVYDLPSSEAEFETRAGELDMLLADFPHPALKLVPTAIVEDAEELDTLYGQYLTEGYEGQMVRFNTLYEVGKRSKNLLKRKEFQSQEFPVSRIIEGVGNWAGYAKAVEFILPGDKRLANGDRPKAGIKGSQAFTRELLGKATPKETTIRFFALTPDGIPRFPIAVDFHEEARST